MAVQELKQTAQEQPVAREVDDERGNEIDLLELFFTLLENVKYVILATVIGALLMGVYSFFIATPKYESSAKLYVLNSNDSVVNLSDLQIGSYLASDYMEVFKTWEVNERVIENLGLDYSYKEMQEMLKLSNPSNTRILYITVESDSPSQAAMIANEYATVSRQYIAETMNTEAPNVLSTALTPTRPISPNKTRNVMLGAVLGAVLAIVIIVVRMLLDDKIKTTDDIQKYAGIPTLAVVPVSDASAIKNAKPDSKKRRR